MGYLDLTTEPSFTRRVSPTSDGVKNQALIHSALQEVKLHGGVIELDGGDFPLITLQGTTPGASAGAYCLRIPSNVRFKGQGMGATRLIATAGGAFGTGAVITPEGMDTASSDYGAASNWAVSDLSLSAPDQAASSGNLISLYHASDFVLENLDLGASYYHALEVGLSSRGLMRRIKFSGTHNGASGNYIQFDNGDGGHRSTVPTTSTISDIILEDLCLLQRPGTGAAMDIEGFHSLTQTLRNVQFRRMYAEGQARDNSMIFDFNVAVTSGGARGVSFDDCTFVTGHYGNQAMRLGPAGAGGWHEGVFVRNCNFRGPGCQMLWAYGNTTATVAVANDDRRNYQILGNTFEFDATQMPASARDYNLMVLNQLSGAIVRGNTIIKRGDFPGGWTHQTACSAVRIGHCRDMTFEDNDVWWYGNNATASRTAIYWSNENETSARRTICRRNTVWSENANVWTYCQLLQVHATVPVANRIFAFTENWATGATSGNLLTTGAP